jgi:DNA-binding NarL/FixJ family response regulator
MSDLPVDHAFPDRKIRIMIVEDHPLLIHGLRRIIEGESDMEVVAEVTDGQAAVEQALEIEPDVILMDINLPRKNGLQATREIKTIHGEDEISVIILTAYNDEEQLFHALCAGASAYYPKDVHPNELLPAIRVTSTGRFVINSTVMNKVDAFRWLLNALEAFSPDKESSLEMFAPLSQREMEILTYITRGASNKEIAYELSISQQTVKNHISNILRKLGVEDRTQAAVLALRRGWIRLEETGRLSFSSK